MKGGENILFENGLSILKGLLQKKTGLKMARARRFHFRGASSIPKTNSTKKQISAFPLIGDMYTLVYERVLGYDRGGWYSQKGGFSAPTKIDVGIHWTIGYMVTCIKYAPPRFGCRLQA